MKTFVVTFFAGNKILSNPLITSESSEKAIEAAKSRTDLKGITATNIVAKEV